jgi:hypothetical protein
MIDLLMEHNLEGNDTIEKYLLKEKKDSEKELRKFKK